MKRFHIGLRRLCSVLLGMVFFVSGCLKLIDPVGAGLVMEEYFKFLHLSFLNPAAEALGVAMALLEALTGAMLVAGTFRKLAALLASCMTAFFTLLTLMLVIFNPSMDCGCFGEAIHLSHWQTFIKNLILCALAATAFLPVRDYGKASGVGKHVAFWLTAAALCAFTIISLTHLPVRDYTEMTPGTELDADVPLLTVSDADMNYDDDFFADKKLVAASVYRPDRLSGAQWEAILDRLEAARREGLECALLTASTPEDLQAILGAAEGLEPVSAMELFNLAYYADYRKLLTLNRSNGGLVYIADAQVIRKWHARHLPDDDAFVAIYDYEPMEVLMDMASSGKYSFQIGITAALALLILL